jgi:EAL domain-containing protein (putative c-di-GMP-specific phosphodiesterase class I)
MTPARASRTSATFVELRPDFVKIDCGLIRGLNADLTRQALVVGLGHFARATNSSVIAEGIETEAERTTLRSLDLRFGQGYLFGRPTPASTWADPNATRRNRRAGDHRGAIGHGRGALGAVAVAPRRRAA